MLHFLTYEIYFISLKRPIEITFVLLIFLSIPFINSGDTKEPDENDETDDGEDSDENNATVQQSVSVGIMFALTWLVIYNIWMCLEKKMKDARRIWLKRCDSNDKVDFWLKKELKNKLDCGNVHWILF